MKALIEYPDLCCFNCGLEASGGRSFEVSTVNQHPTIKCDICEQYDVPVTELRDFFHPSLNNINKIRKRLKSL